MGIPEAGIHHNLVQGGIPLELADSLPEQVDIRLAPVGIPEEDNLEVGNLVAGIHVAAGIPVAVGIHVAAPCRASSLT